MLPQNPTDATPRLDAPTPVDDATYRALRASLTRRLGGDAALADDLLQDSLLQFLRKQHTLRDDAAALAFLRTIIARRVADHYRRGRTAAEPLPAHEAGAREASAESEHHQRLTESLGLYLGLAIGELPAPYREAIDAVELRGLSQRAYAERAGLPYSTAKSRVQRGRQLLREAVTNCCDVEHDAYGTILAVRPRCCPPGA